MVAQSHTLLHIHYYQEDEIMDVQPIHVALNKIRLMSHLSHFF